MERAADAKKRKRSRGDDDASRRKRKARRKEKKHREKREEKKAKKAKKEGRHSRREAHGGESHCQSPFVLEQESSSEDSSEAAHNRAYAEWAFLDVGRQGDRDEDREWQERLREEDAFDNGQPNELFLDSCWDQETTETDWFETIAAQAAAKAAAQAAKQAEEKAERVAAALGRSQRRHISGTASDADGDHERRERQAAAEAAFDASTRMRNEVESSLEVSKARAREAYAQGWAVLLMDKGTGPLGLRDFPWPCRCNREQNHLASTFTADTIADMVLLPGLDKSERRRSLQAEMRRWHPDKFVSRWLKRLVEADVPQVLERVKNIAQALNELMARTV